jgi:hypothetical protein
MICHTADQSVTILYVFHICEIIYIYISEYFFSPELVHKVFVLVGKSLKLPDVTKLLETNLNYILVHWTQQQYAVQVL